MVAEQKEERKKKARSNRPYRRSEPAVRRREIIQIILNSENREATIASADEHSDGLRKAYSDDRSRYTRSSSLYTYVRILRFSATLPSPEIPAAALPPSLSILAGRLARGSAGPYLQTLAAVGGLCPPAFFTFPVPPRASVSAAFQLFKLYKLLCSNFRTLPYRSSLAKKALLLAVIGLSLVARFADFTDNRNSVSALLQHASDSYSRLVVIHHESTLLISQTRVSALVCVSLLSRDIRVGPPSHSTRLYVYPACDKRSEREKHSAVWPD